MVVSDLERARPIWFGGQGRREEDFDQFFAALGAKKIGRLQLAVMDMWRPFRNSLERNAPRASIIFDKFHVLRHLGNALDEVRRSEYRRLSGKDRTFIKGQRYTLLSRWENLSRDGRHSLKKLLAANRRLNTAYVLKEQFGQLWDYRREGWARAFFERWRDALKWQRLEPYEKFAAMIERHWDGIAAYCKPENKVSLGVVEGLNNKIRVSTGWRPWCKPGWRPIRFPVRCSCFGAGGVIGSKSCGGMATATGCVFSRSDWSRGASSGPGRPTAWCRSRRPSCRCCWKASTGGVRCGPRRCGRRDRLYSRHDRHRCVAR